MKDAYLLPCYAQRLELCGVFWCVAGEKDIVLKGDEATEDVAVEREQGILGQVGVKVGQPCIARTDYNSACWGLGEANDPAELPGPVAEPAERRLEFAGLGVRPDAGPKSVAHQKTAVAPFQKDPDGRDRIDRIVAQLDDFFQLEDLVERG